MAETKAAEAPRGDSDDKKSLELQKLRQERAQLRKNNSAALVAQSRQELIRNKSKLKADVKRTTAFVKKSKAISEDNCAVLLKDVENLNLSRYVSEVVAGILDAPIKSKDVFATVKFVSSMHQKYEDFTLPLLQSIEDEFTDLVKSSVTGNDKAAISRVRVLLKLAAELVLCGVADNPAFCIKMVRRLTRLNMKSSASGTVKSVLSNEALSHHQAVSSFVKSFGYEFMAMPVNDIEENGSLEKDNSIVMASLQERSTSLIHDYYRAMVARLMKENTLLARRRERNKTELMNRGSLNKVSVEKLESQKELVENILKIVENFANILGKEAPQLEDEEDKEQIADKAAGIALWDRRRETDGNAEESIEAFMYGGEEIRAFYEDLVPIQTLVPVSMLGELIPQQQGAEDIENEDKASQQTQVSRKASGTGSKGTLDQALQQLGLGGDTPSTTNLSVPHVQAKSKPPPVTSKEKKKTPVMTKQRKSKIDIEDYIEEYDYESDEENNFEIQISGMSREVQEILARLPECLSCDAMDNFCIEFCTVSNKQSKAALLKALCFIPSNRMELVPCYARIVATLSQVFDDFGPKVAGKLIGQFRYLVKSTSSHRLASKIRNARYIGELVKFNRDGLGIPAEKVFYVLNSCFKNFSGSNINYVCELLETTGRYLYRNPDTHVATSRLLETLWKFRKQKNLSSTLNTIVENAYFFSKATDTETRQMKRKFKSPEKQYVEYLLFSLLGEKQDEVEAKAKPGAKYRKQGKSWENMHIKPYAEGCSYVLAKLLKLPWDSKFEETVDLLSGTILKASKFRTHCLPLAAHVVVRLTEYYPKFGTRFVDRLLERIESDLTVNDSRRQQKRLGQCRLFGFLFSFRLVDRYTYFDTLFLIINHGHSLPWPDHIAQANKAGSREEMIQLEKNAKEERLRCPRGPDFNCCSAEDPNKFHPLIPSSMDPPDEIFRILLVCEILNYSGNWYRMTHLSKSLNRFWTYFERYAFSKTSNTQLMHHQINETLQKLKSAPPKKSKKYKKSAQSKMPSMTLSQALSLRPRTPLESSQRVEELERAELHERDKRASTSNLDDMDESAFDAAAMQEEDEEEEEEDDDEEEEDEEEDDEDEDDADTNKGTIDDEDEEEEEEDDDEDDDDDDDFSDDDMEFYSDDGFGGERFDLEEQAEKQFEQEFAQLMQYSQPQLSKTGASSSHNMAIPKHMLRVQKDTENDFDSQVKDNSADPGVKFRLIKRGTKGRIEALSMVIPKETEIVKKNKKDEAAEKREHELMKKLVLQYEQTQQYEDSLTMNPES